MFISKKILTTAILFIVIASTVFALKLKSNYFSPQSTKEVKQSSTEETIKPIPTVEVSSSPSASGAPKLELKPKVIATQQPTPDVKASLNEYSDCKKACPLVGGGTTCTENSENGDHSKSCTITRSNPDEKCIESCKSKYGFTF